MQLTRTLERGKSLYEQTYEALRSGILTGELAPGDRLVETQIAEQLQVSRTPIREAIRQLQREELVATDANGWLRVATVSAAEANHLYDCRIALETLSVTTACERGEAKQIERLRVCVEEAEAMLNQEPEAGSPPPASIQLLEADYRFHHLIAELSGNTCLISLLEQVFNKMTLLRMQTTLQNPRVLEIRTEHRRILEAIAKGDVATAVEAMQSHLSASKKRVVQELERLTNAEPDS